MNLNKFILKNKPTKNIMNNVDKILKSLDTGLKKHGYFARAVLGGSVAKDTHLNKFDCDIFIVFHKDSKDISNKLEKVVKEFKPIKVHGSRDYFQFVKYGINFEVVPVLENKNPEEVVNVTDMSPFHVAWVTKNIKNLADDIRAAKLFCKANDLYGAESHINGFSGYILEILVINYGGFEKLLKAATKWQNKTIIDFQNYYKNKNPLKTLNSSKTHGPLIIIDPVQKNRNAAAALSEDKFAKFIFLSKLYLESPSMDFFESTKTKFLQLKKEAVREGFSAGIIEIKPLEGKRDVVGAKIKKIYELIKKQIEINDFVIFDSMFKWDEGKNAKLLYIISPVELPKYKSHKGPIIFADNKNIFDFIEKHEEIMLQNNHIYAKVKRKYRTLKVLLKSTIKEDFIKTRAKKITLL